jgi:hypothetical protein
MYDENTGSCVVVVEQGADWLGSETERSVSSTGRAMVFQQPSETPAEFALRVRRRVQVLRQSSTEVEVAVIAASDATDDETFQARCQIAQALLSAMGAEAPRLVFEAPASISNEGRHELLSIAGTLTSQLHGSPIEVSVRFGESRRSPADATTASPSVRQTSGVHRISRAVDVA